MNNFFKIFIILIVFCSCAVTFPAYGTETLKMLLWEGYAPPNEIRVFKDFIKQKYGKTIEVEIKHVSAPQDFFDALRGQKVHIISPAHNLIKDERFGFIKYKFIIPLDLKKIPNYKNIIPSLQRIEYATDRDGNVYGVPITHGPYGLAYNTKYFKTAPTSRNVFWDKRWKNKYSISRDYSEANVYITALSEGFNDSDIYNFSKLRSNKKIHERLSLLVANAHSFWEGVDTANDLQGLALATAWGFSFNELEKRGEIWKMANPKEGVTGWVDHLLLSRSLEQSPFLKKVAEEWLNYILNPAFQANIIIRQLRSGPVVTTANHLLTEQEIEDYHLNDHNYYKEKMKLWPILSKDRYERSGLDNLWEQAMDSRSIKP